MAAISSGATKRITIVTIVVTCDCIEPKLLSWSGKSLRGANQPTYKHRPIDATGNKILVENVSRKLKMFNPNSFMLSSTPNDSEHIGLKINSGNKTRKHAFVRDIFKWSLTNDTETSAIDTVDVSAATNSRRKNRIDHICVPGSCANTSGSVTNTKVAPSRL
jgi:hypothetical protein